MGLGNHSKDWGEPDGYDDYGDSGGGGDSGGKMTRNERLVRFRFQIPTPKGKEKFPNLVPGRPATKRVLILDDPPFCLHEHSLYNFHGAWKILENFSALCLARNGYTDRGCPLCDKNGGDNFPYFIGFFPVIDMGQVKYVGSEITLFHEYWTDKKGENHYRSFEKKLLGAKRGSQEKPGVLKTLQLKMERHGGSLKGTVWDVTRTGDQSATVGDSWDYVDKIRPEDYSEYLQGFGADHDALDLEIPTWFVEGGKAGDGLFNIDVDDYYNRLARIVGWGTNNGSQRSEARSDGAGFGNYTGDDDIPF